MKKYFSKSKFQTQKLASKFALQILKTNPEPRRRIGATIIALQGNLGSGKTTFVQGFLKMFGVKQSVTSPTFLIIRRYYLKNKKFKNVFHLDLYRIKKPKELLDLGFKKIINNPENIVLIEWPEKIKKLLPKNTVWVNFEHFKKINQRKITLSFPKGKV